MRSFPHWTWRRVNCRRPPQTVLSPATAHRPTHFFRGLVPDRTASPSRPVAASVPTDTLPRRGARRGAVWFWFACMDDSYHLNDVNNPDYDRHVRVRLSRAERAAQTRADLLAAARSVFAQRGYAGASVTDIAEAAGYSHGAVYSNFAGKQDLFLALFDEHINQRTAALAKDLARAEGTPAQRARAAADGMMRRARREPDAFLLH